MLFDHSAHQDDGFSSAAFAMTIPPIPAPPLAMGGYKKILPAPQKGFAVPARIRYLKEAAELKQALANGTTHPETCNPRLQGFADMIEKVRRVPDRLTQLLIVNAYVNMIDFDTETATKAKRNSDHPSLTQSLLTHKALCSNAAALKMFALLEMGFASHDVQWTAEILHIDGIPQKNIGHAVTLVRVRDTLWVMNIDKPSIKPGSLLPQDAEKLVCDASRVETDTTHMNFSNGSRWLSATEYYTPSFAFTADKAIYYKLNVPLKDLSNVDPIAHTAPSVNTCLSTDDLRRYDVMAILAPVISINYDIVYSNLPVIGERIVDLSGTPDRIDGKRQMQQSVTNIYAPT